MISDSAGAIRNAFQKVFEEETTPIMCWFHMKKNAVTKIKALVPVDQQKEAKDDINNLHIASDKRTFDMGVRLFRKKWENEVEFMSYMDKMWLSSHQTWYSGAAEAGVPLTNNSLESFNSKIKKQGTFRERMKIRVFLDRMITVMKVWSKNSDVNAELDIPFITWTKGYHCFKIKARIYRKNSSSHYGAIFPARGKKVTADHVTQYREKKFRSFSVFKKMSTLMWDVKLKKDDWKKGTCTCPVFMVRYMCHHIIDFALRLDLTTPPPEVTSIPIGSKRKPGRPTKASKALIVD